MYDVIVIGGGPGGYMAAEKAGHAGLKTLLVEKEHLGGVCLNEGCIPTKTLLNSAKLYSHCTEHSLGFGVSCENPKLDHPAVINRKNQVVKTLVSGVQFQMKQNHVEVVTGVGSLAGKDGDVFKVKVEGGEIYESKNVILAAGSSTVVPPIDGVKESLENGFCMTSREILDATDVPKSLVVVGGGVIGLEFVSYFNTLGTKITVIEMLDKIAGPTEKDLSTELMKVLKKRGVEFILGAKVTAVKDGAVSYELGDEKGKVECERVLLSVGRKANSANLGLEELGVNLERGKVVTDSHLETNVKGLYAVGDINGKIMLAHTAYGEAYCAVNNILGKKDEMDYTAIPSVIYTNPEIATVGYDETSAANAGYDDVEVIKIPMAYSGRFIAENNDMSGFCKILFDRKSKTMIGAHVMSNYASEFIEICANLITLKTTVAEMKKLIFPHPTVCEIIREAIHFSAIE